MKLHVWKVEGFCGSGLRIHEFGAKNWDDAVTYVKFWAGKDTDTEVHSLRKTTTIELPEGYDDQGGS